MEKLHILAVILALGLIASSLVFAYASKTNVILTTQNPKDAKNSITVSGTGDVTAEPDEAQLYVRIDTQGTTALEAQEQNSVVANSVIQALQREGVQKKDIETSQFNLYPKQEFDGVKYVQKGYTQTHVLKITTYILNKVGKLTDTAIKAGANGVDQVSFTLTDAKQKEAQQQALNLASKEAQNKAQALAASVQGRLGALLSVTESAGRSYPLPYYATSVMKESADSSPIQPKNIDVTTSVTLVYEIA
ncbi:SIMPL domain-containing protein [Candidatus Woesearchaeota archaeon]|nr:SIMPL domain-containing protein [Candidatus Woesearchaeota archaeon]